MITLFRQRLHSITSRLFFLALLCETNFAHVPESSISNAAIDDFTSMLAVRSATLSYREAALNVKDELHSLLSNDVQDLLDGPVQSYSETAKQSLGVTKTSGNTTNMKSTAAGPGSLVRTMGRSLTCLLHVGEPSYVGIGIVFILILSLCCMTCTRLLGQKQTQYFNDDDDDLHEVWVKKPSALSQQRDQLNSLFAKLDDLNQSDDSPEGYITYPDLQKALADPEFAVEFMQYGITNKDAFVMFDSLDDTGDGLVCYRAFVDGVVNRAQWRHMAIWHHDMEHMVL